MKLKTLNILTALSLLSTPVFADGHLLTCSEDSMAIVMEQVNATSGDTQTAAMAELDMAKEKMNAGDADACAVHLTNASKVATGG